MENSLLSGAWDLHIHLGPDVLARKLDDIDMAERARACGMAGFGIKSHYFNTADRAKLVNKLFPDVHAVGTVWLNNASGGINPYAVEIAGRAGTKIVGFPTVDTYEGITKTENLPPDKRAFWGKIIIELKQAGIRLDPVRASEDGKLRRETLEVIDIIAKYDMVLATGHLLPEDCLLVTKAAYERGVKRIICTHVSAAGAGYDVSYQKEMLRYGCFMEHTTQSWSSGKVPFEKMVSQIKEVGIERCIISTDLGQPKNVYPDEGLLEFCTRLVEEGGFSEDDVRKAIVGNPKALVG